MAAVVRAASRALAASGRSSRRWMSRIGPANPTAASISSSSDSANGSPSFRSTYKEYVRNHGFPTDPAVLVLLLDLDDEREVLRVLEAIESIIDSAPLEQKNLLRSRLRNLEMSASSDSLGDAAADLASRL